MKMAVGVMVLCCSLAGNWVPAQGTRPDFSGTWRLNREKSVFHRPTFREPPGIPPPGGMGGGGMGGPGVSGGPGGPGGGMGGPGGGPVRMGGPGGWSGTGGRAGMGPGAGAESMGVAEVLNIVHQEPRLEISIPIRFGAEQQTLVFKHTTDGSKHRHSLPGGVTARSKTRWKKNRLITESTSDGPMGTVTIVEVRSLSDDRKTMTVDFTLRAGMMELKRELVYERGETCPPSP